MSEARIILLLLAGVAGWTAGGTWWKGWRRYVWPAAATLLLIPSIDIVHQAEIFGLMALVNSLPYGDRTPCLVRLAVFGSLALPCAVLDWQVAAIGAIVVMALLGGLFWLSRKINTVTWKVWEATAGISQASLLVIATLC